MALLQKLERYFLQVPQGVCSRLRMGFYILLGFASGGQNRMEKSRCRRLSQIVIGKRNAFTQGAMLWPEDAAYNGIRIQIGDRNYFNRNIMIMPADILKLEAIICLDPIFISPIQTIVLEKDISPSAHPMQRGKVKIGSHCWIGAKAIILKDVELGDYCVVAAGAVVTKVSRQEVSLPVCLLN